jgi:hypothetical protein
VVRSLLSCRLLFSRLGPARLLSFGNLLPRGGRELPSCSRLGSSCRCGMIPSQFFKGRNGLVQTTEFLPGAAPFLPQLRKRATEVNHGPPFFLH